VTYFAAALTRTGTDWTGREIDLDLYDDLEALADDLRDLAGETTVLLLEENDEYVGVVRVDGGTGSLEEPKVFLSDRRAVLASGVSSLLWEDTGDEVDAEDDEDDDGVRPVAEPVGDPAVLSDLGTSADDLLELCAEEGLLPADVLTGVAERAGFLDVLDSLREA
jgi:putative tRNA adenosine deaminase-associated protein